jgi:hypothetical protein
MRYLIHRILPFYLLLQLGTETTFAWTQSPTTWTPPSRSIRSSTPLCLASSSSGDSSASSITQQQRVPSSSSYIALSRREWFWGVSSAAAAAVALPPSAMAATTTLSRPPALVSTAAVCDPTVSVWERGNRIIYLLGTAHVSSASAQLAGQLVRDVHPEGVFVELDLKRVGGLTKKKEYSVKSVTERVNLDTISPTTLSSSSSGGGGGATENALVPASQVIVTTVSPALAVSATDVTSVIPVAPEPKGLRAKALNFGAAQVGNAIKGMYKDIEKEGFKPGEEFVLAVQEGQKIGSAIILGDQDVEVTLRRLVEGLAKTDLNKLMDPDSPVNRNMQELLPGGSSTDPTQALSKDELSNFVESMKTRERVRLIMGELNEVAPALVQVMLTERDAYMAAGLDTLEQFNSIVAVMGIAHVDGVEKNLRSNGWKQLTPRCPKQ